MELRFRSQSTHILQPGSDARDVGSALRALQLADRAVVVSDETVGPLHAGGVVKSLATAGFNPEGIFIKPGDSNKSQANVSMLHDWLATIQADRQTAIVAVGGGMIGDLAGFVAATWMRGVPWINIPTTTLAMCDSCLGGKTGINHAHGKNLIGAFHHPAMIWVDVAMLASLPDEPFRGGLAESIKHGIVLDRAFLEWQQSQCDHILKRDRKTLSELVARNLKLKGEVVTEDERESSGDTIGRAALNFGHTIGHAIEHACDYALSHGHCVALGMVAESELAVATGHLGADDQSRIESVLQAFGLPTRLPNPISADAILKAMQRDKKNRHGTIRFALPSGLGNAVRYSADGDDLVRAAIGWISA